MNKKIIAVIIIVLAVLILLFLLTKGKSTETIPSETPISNKDIPIIPKPYIQNLPISDSGINISIPTTMKVFSARNVYVTKEEAQNVGEALGFTSQMQTFGTQNAEVFFFSDEDKTLRIESYSGTLSLKSNNLTKDPIGEPNIKNTTEIALDYLVNKGMISSQSRGNLILEKYTKLSIQDELSNYEDPPNAISLSFTTKVSDYPVFSSTYSTGLINVVLNSSLEVSQVRIQKLRDYETLGEGATYNIEEIKTAMPEKAILQTCEDDKINPADIDISAIDAVQPQSIEIGYLEQNRGETTYLQPIFLIKAQVIALNDINTNCVFYMQAIKGE